MCKKVPTTFLNTTKLISNIRENTTHFQLLVEMQKKLIKQPKMY